jgi:hypothetical protein
MLLLSFLTLRSPRRAIQASVIVQLLVCLAAARFLVPELLRVARGEDAGWAGRLFIVGSAPFCSSPSLLRQSFPTTLPPPVISATSNEAMRSTASCAMVSVSIL